MVILSSAQISYSGFNTTSAYYNNNSFTFSFPKGGRIASYTIFTVNIPDAFYTRPDLNSYMQQLQLQVDSIY